MSARRRILAALCGSEKDSRAEHQVPEDFSIHPSWCDAKLAIKLVQQGKAHGSIPALRLRAFFQHWLWKMGLFIEEHVPEVLFLGVLIFALFCIPLGRIQIETNLDKLWVEKGGYLEQEQAYTAEINAEQNKDMAAATSSISASGDGLQYLMVIQTPLKGRGTDILNTADLLVHEELLQEIVRMEIEALGVRWTLQDLCYKPTIGNLPTDGLLGDLSKTLLQLIPCIIISPLDCYWEGSKQLGPFPPLDLGDLQQILRSLSKRISWRNLNVAALMEEIDVYKILLDDGTKEAIDNIERILNDMGITDGYQSKPCLNPYDPECPKSAPNYNSKSVPDHHYVMRDGCRGMAPKLMHWPTDMILGAYKYGEQVNVNNVTQQANFTKAEALQSVLLLASADSVYNRWKDAYSKDRLKSWSVADANEVLTMWQRNFSQIIYQSKFNMNGTLRQWFSSVHNTPDLIMTTWNLSVPLNENGTDTHPQPYAPTYWQHVDQDVVFATSNSSTLGLSLSRKFDIPPMFDPFAGTSLGDMMNELSDFNPGFIILDYLIMFFYAIISLWRCHSRGVYSCVGLGISGCLLMMLSSAAGIGLSIQAGLTISAVTTQILPFIALGLGVDDMFILIHSYIDIVKISDKHVVANLLRETGFSSLISSLNNVLAFLFGGLLPVPALRAFCWQVAILLSFNIVALLTLFPCMIAIDLMRQNHGRTDLLCCIHTPQYRKRPRHGATYPVVVAPVANHTKGEELPPAYDRVVHSPSQNGRPIVLHHEPIPQAKKNKKSCAASEGCATVLQKFGGEIYAKFLSFKIIKVCILLIFGAMLAAGIYGATRVPFGLELTDVVPKGTAVYEFLWAREQYFSFYPMNAIVKGNFYYEKCSGQYLLHAYRDDLRHIRFAVNTDETSFGGTYWLRQMTEWLQAREAALIDARRKKQITEKGLVCDGSGAFLASHEAILAYKLAVSVGDSVDHSLWNDNLTVTADAPICQGEVKNASGIRFIHPRRFYNALTAWVKLDAVGYQVSFADLVPVPDASWSDTRFACSNPNITDQDLLVTPSKPLKNSQLFMFLKELTDTPAMMEMIQTVRGIGTRYKSTGLNVFPDGIPFVFWDQYLFLRNNLLKAIGFILLVVFVVNSVVLMSVWTGFIVVSVLLMMVVELAGFMTYTGLKLNPVSSVILVTSVGIGVVYTVHYALSFLTALGDRDLRTKRTMDHMFTPVLHSGVSNLVGIIMLAASPFMFVVKYFFMTLAALIIIGTLNGLILLPVILSVIGPLPEVRPIPDADHLDPPAPDPPVLPSSLTERNGTSRSKDREEYMHDEPHA